jgi:hypothetical protein
MIYLHLHFVEPVFPDDSIRSDSIFTVVHQYDHAIRVHRLSNVKVVIFEICDDFLGIRLGAVGESLDLALGATLLSHVLFDRLHVCWDGMGKGLS